MKYDPTEGDKMAAGIPDDILVDEYDNIEDLCDELEGDY